MGEDIRNPERDAVRRALPLADTDAVTDTFGRPMRDLRVSVTDRCNFRCTYCMPKEIFGPQFAFLPREEILNYEEIARFVRIATSLGVRKVRVTGGEPLLRRHVELLVGMLAGAPGVEDLSLTTNGSVLPQKAEALAAAGLRRVTVSLDSVDDEVFRAMNDVSYPVARVLEGIDAAAAHGLTPVKVNAVVRRGVNDHTVVDTAAHFRGTGHIVRFIEYMDVGTTNGWCLDDVVPAREIVERIDAVFPLEAAERNYRGEVAERYRYRDGEGEIGVIASVTQPFCGDCTRLRLSADGKLYTCLFGAEACDVRALVRGGASDDEIAEELRAVWGARGDRYSELRTAETPQLDRAEMFRIGG